MKDPKDMTGAELVAAVEAKREKGCGCDTCTGKYKEPGYVAPKVWRGSGVGFSESEVKAWVEKRDMGRGW